MRHFKIVVVNSASTDKWYKEIFCFSDAFYDNTPLTNVLPGDGWRVIRNDEHNKKFEPIIIV